MLLYALNYVNVWLYAALVAHSVPIVLGSNFVKFTGLLI